MQSAVLLILLGCTDSSQTPSTTNRQNADAKKPWTDSLQHENRRLQEERDSISQLYRNTVQIFDSLDQKLHAEIDRYWKRAPYYISPKENERFYSIKASVINDTIRFYFLGIDFPKKEDDLVANIYELDYNKEIHIIDSIKILGIKLSANDSESFHFEETLLRQLDNLVIQDDKLFYYQETQLPTSYDTYKEILKKREYHFYEIGTKKKPRTTNKACIGEVITFGLSQNRWVINPDTTIIAHSDNTNISLYPISDWNKIKEQIYKQDIYSTYSYIIELPALDFNINYLFHEKYNNSSFKNESSMEEVFFGGISWHYDEYMFYFDNSGYDYRCIWEADINQKHVAKIVPEHEAIHPFFFKHKANEYVAYVEGRKIMLAESPKNKSVLTIEVP